jgi:transcriptional regulator with XRE-family HTH domain
MDDEIFPLSKYWNNKEYPVIEELYTSMDEIIESFSKHRGDTIKNLKQDYLDEFDIPLNDRQEKLFKELNYHLEELSQESLRNLNPELFYVFDWDKDEDNKPQVLKPGTPLYNLKARLTEFLDFLTFFTSAQIAYNDEITKKTKYAQILLDNKLLTEAMGLLTKKLEILNNILSEIVKFIFANRISYLAKKKRFTQTEIAKKLVVRQQTVSDWFRGISLPSVEKISQIASLLETSIDYLVRFEISEIDLANDIIYKETGLTSESINKLKCNTNTEFINTLNTLIENYGFASDTDLVGAISKYLRLPYNQTVSSITQEDLDQMRSQLFEYDNIHDIRVGMTSYINNFHELSTIYGYDTSDILLLDITKILTRIRDSIMKEKY